MEKIIIGKNFLEKALLDSDELQFKLAALYMKQAHYNKAERWLRYAAINGNDKAKQSLKQGVQRKKLMSTEQYLNLFAIEILEKLVTPFPSQTQIDELENILRCFIDK